MMGTSDPQPALFYHINFGAVWDRRSSHAEDPTLDRHPTDPTAPPGGSMINKSDRGGDP
jgi:hypothetical protein